MLRQSFAPLFGKFCLSALVAGCLLLSGTGVLAAGSGDGAFVNIKCGAMQVSSKEMPALKTISIMRGKVMALYYEQGEVLNSVKVSTPDGEVVLLTKSLDKSILLQTTSLTPGDYILEVGSAGQKAEGRLVVN